jgi:hypothetical protein
LREGDLAAAIARVVVSVFSLPNRLLLVVVDVSETDVLAVILALQVICFKLVCTIGGNLWCLMVIKTACSGIKTAYKPFQMTVDGVGAFSVQSRLKAVSIRQQLALAQADLAQEFLNRQTVEQCA